MPGVPACGKDKNDPFWFWYVICLLVKKKKKSDNCMPTSSVFSLIKATFSLVICFPLYKET